MPPRRPLQLSGRLRIERAGHELHVTAEHHRVYVNAPSVAALKQLMDSGGAPAGGGSAGLQKLTDLLADHGVTVELQLKGHTVASLGQDTDPGWLEKTLKLQGVDLNAKGLLKALFKRGT